MTKDNQNDGEVFNVDKIRDLVQLMKEHDLSEVDLRASTRQIKLRRGPKEVAPMMQMPAMGYAPPAAAPNPAAPQQESAPATASDTPAADDSNAVFINSPMVGTFYSKPKPDTPDFVKVGDTVTPDSVVCIIEAMKMFNEIPAGVSGKIVEILVKNEEAVDVNKPLFKIAPA